MRITLTSLHAIRLNQLSLSTLTQCNSIYQGHKLTCILPCLTSYSCHEASLALQQAWLVLQHWPQTPTLHCRHSGQHDILNQFAAIPQRPSRETGLSGAGREARWVLPPSSACLCFLELQLLLSCCRFSAQSWQVICQPKDCWETATRYRLLAPWPLSRGEQSWGRPQRRLGRAHGGSEP